MISDLIVGSGLFQVTVQLLNGTAPLPHNYSLSPGEAVVVEVSMNTSAEQIKVVINSCWATPTQNPADIGRYIFLDNRCASNYNTVCFLLVRRAGNGTGEGFKGRRIFFDQVDNDTRLSRRHMLKGG